MKIYYIVLHGKQEKNEEKNEKVIDGLKKYNRTMLILKIVIVVLSIFIICMWGKIIIKRVEEGIELKENYEKGQYIYDIIDKVYCNINEIKKTNNYLLVEESTAISYDFNFVYNYMQNRTFYKDGYFKEEHNNYSNGINSTIDSNYVNYGVMTKDKTFYTQSTNGEGHCDIAVSSATNENMNNILEIYHKENVLDYKDYEIREEKIAEKKYYVISNKENIDDKVYYYEIWIDKDNMQLYKIISEKVGCQKSETKFTLTAGNVKDEDVKLSFAGKNEKIQNLSKLFDKINNGEFEDNEEQAWLWNFGLNNNNSKVLFDNYVKPNKKLISKEEGLEIISKKYQMKAGGYSYKAIIFDQNGDAFYAYCMHDTIEGKNTFIQNIFVSIFGDVIKTNKIDKELKEGEVEVL